MGATEDMVEPVDPGGVGIHKVIQDETANDKRTNRKSKKALATGRLARSQARDVGASPVRGRRHRRPLAMTFGSCGPPRCRPPSWRSADATGRA